MVRHVLSSLTLVLAVHTGCADSKEHKLGAADAGAPKPDAASTNEAEAAVRGAVCTPQLPQCGPGEKCIGNRTRIEEGWAEPRCTKDQGAEGLTEREACLSDPGVFDYCGTGLSCTNFGSGEGFCVRQCSVPGTECAEGEVCAPVDLEYGLRLCLPSCERTEDCEFAGFFQCVTNGGVSYCDVTMDR